MKNKHLHYISNLFFISSFVVLFIACDIFSENECKPRLPDQVKKIVFEFSDNIESGEVKIYSNNMYDCCRSWLDDDAFETLSYFVMNNSSIGNEPFNIVLYLKGLISNDTIIKDNDIYGFSCYDYNHEEQTLRMRTFIRDIKSKKFIEIRELDTYISGWVVNYIDIIANELIVELLNNDKTAINFYSLSKVTSIDKPRIKKKYRDDNFRELAKQYIKSVK